MSRTTPLLLMLLAGVLVCAPASADDDDAALMKACPGLAAWAASHPHRSDEAAQHDAGRRFTAPALRSELAARAAADQAARDAVIATAGKDKAATARLLATDADNLSWLKGVVGRQGFPTPEAVGEQGVSNAWLLVQHADRDPSFQAAVLEALQAHPAASGVRKEDIAMLTDRVLRAQGKPQRYASQFMPGSDGNPVPEPTDDLAGVDARRAAMNLMPLSVYRCVLRVSYAPSAKATE